MSKGIYYSPYSVSSPYRAALTYRGKSIYIGSYETEEEAVKAFNKARKEYPLVGRQKYKPWREKDRQELLQLWFKMSCKEIAKQMKRTESSVYQMAHKLNAGKGRSL